MKDGTLFLLYGLNDFEKMTNSLFEYAKGLTGYFEIPLYVDAFVYNSYYLLGDFEN